MTKPKLTVQRLVEGGFEGFGCWELNNDLRLTHSIELPPKGGVYAFAIDGIAQYVGLASKSVRQRFGFYRRPGQTQPTNLRINELIRSHLNSGAKVEILVAHPPEHRWNGFKVSGAEGLEAGIISEFDLPWNMRGSVSESNRPVEPTGSSVRRQSGRANRILMLLRENPGLTGGEIARALYGPPGAQPQVNPLLQKLMAERLIERIGLGRRDPYRYYLTTNLS